MPIYYILDTDHLSLLERGHLLIRSHIALLPVNSLSAAIISADEMLQGRLAMAHRAKNQAQAVSEYKLFQATLAFLTAIQLLPYDLQAAQRFDDLRRQGIRIGTQDLRIACIAWSNNAIEVTRNARDFDMVPELATEDWSQPIA